MGKGLAAGEGFAVGDAPAPAADSAPAQAVAALVALGYNASDAARFCTGTGSCPCTADTSAVPSGRRTSVSWGSASSV